MTDQPDHYSHNLITQLSVNFKKYTYKMYIHETTQVCSELGKLNAGFQRILYKLIQAA